MITNLHILQGVGEGRGAGECGKVGEGWQEGHLVEEAGGRGVACLKLPHR